MAISKVEYIGRVLIDLTQDTVSENNLLSGVVAHDATGRQITGALENVGDGKYIWAKHIGKVWDITTTELGTTGPSDSSSYSYGYYVVTDEGYFVLKGEKGVLGDGYAYIKGKGAETHPKSVYQLNNTYAYGSGFTKHYYRLDISDTYTEGKGSFVGYVSSDVSSDYPDDGLKDGYYYVKMSEGTSSGSGTNTSDATVVASDILSGKIAYGKDGKLTGTMKNNGSVSGSIDVKDGVYIVPQGYHDGSGKVQIAKTEQNKLIPANIKKGISILGVPGSYEATSSGGLGGDTTLNAEVQTIANATSPSATFSGTGGTYKVYGYGKGTTSGYTTPQYAFCGDKYYTMASWGNPTPKSMTISVDENGNITGLPALASGNLTIVRTP